MQASECVFCNLYRETYRRNFFDKPRAVERPEIAARIVEPIDNLFLYRYPGYCTSRKRDHPYGEKFPNLIFAVTFSP